MLCKAMQTETNVEVTGLCHSVQGTVAMLAEWLETPVDEIDYLCAGVNHQAFYLKLEHNGQDLYPKARKEAGELLSSTTRSRCATKCSGIWAITSRSPAATIPSITRGSANVRI